MRDLRDKLTVFVIVAGDDPNEKLCFESLAKQTCQFNLNIIRNYAPLSAAFQQMLTRCQTDYFIQVDVDMALHQNAVEKMYNDIIAQDPKMVMLAYELFDPHLEMNIYGVKIYNHTVFKLYPYNQTHPSCEMEQLERLQQDGYTYKCIPEVMGQHSVHWTSESIFERYYNLASKFKIFRYIWMEKLLDKLWNKVKKDPSDQNIYALSGALSAIYSDESMDKEKDVRVKRKDFGRIKGFLNQPHQATIYLTSHCNFKCSWCSNQHGNSSKVPDVTPAIVDKILCKFPNINGMAICGFGEPLSSPQLVPVLQKLKSANKFAGIITNGSLLVQKLPTLIGWYKPNYISVSLNAHNAEEHERITGTKTWDIVISGIKASVASGIETYVSSVITTQNMQHIPEFLSLVKSLGVQTVHLHNLLPPLDLKDLDTTFWPLVLQYEHTEVIDAFKQLPDATIVKSWPTLIDKSGGHSACKFLWYSLAVDGSGALSFCNSCLPCDKKYGNIDDFVIWNSAIAQQFRDDYCAQKLPHCKLCFRNWKMGFRTE